MIKSITSSPAFGRGPELVLESSEPLSLTARIADRVARNPNGIIRSYAWGRTQRTSDFASLWGRAGAIAGQLAARGACPGSIVVILAEDILDFLPAFWACLRGGFVAAPLMSAAREAIFRNDRSFDTVVSSLNDPTILADATFAKALARASRGRKIVDLSLITTSAEWTEHDPPLDPACLVATSGSTGTTKLVALTHSTMIYRNFERRAEKTVQLPNALGTFPLDTVTGQHAIYLHHENWTQLAPRTFAVQPSLLLDAIEDCEISVLSLTSSMIARLLSDNSSYGRPRHLSSLQRIGIGAEPVLPHLVQRLSKLIASTGANPTVSAGYGTTETGTLVQGATVAVSHGPVCLGPPWFGVDMRIVDDAGATVQSGEIGRVEVSCPTKMFSGYWNNPDLTKESFTADGWYKTGDLGSIVNGELTLHGRSKEIFIHDGRKLSLAEIDAELQDVIGADAVAHCFVTVPVSEGPEELAVACAHTTSAQDPELMEKIKAALIRRFGIDCRHLHLVDDHAIPRTAAGKIRRTELADRIRQGLLAAALQASQAVPALQGAKAEGVAALEDKLARIWREVLDLHGELDRQVSFFDLGGDSLRSLMLYTSIETQFGQQISAEAFFASPTFADLLRLVARGGAPSALGPEPSRLAVPWPLPDYVRNKLLVHFESWDGSRPTRDRLVAGLNLAGSKISLFWVFQEAIEFRKIARVLGPDQPIYAFRSGIGLIEYQEDEVQALALRYVSEIEEVCPEGPVFVGGTCQGTIIALAMAQHLLRRKRDVPLLMLMEWGFPLQHYAGPVLLIHGRESIQGNPFLRYRDPDGAFAQAFPDYAIAEMPGDHDHVFEDANVAVLGEILATYMRKAESAPPRLIPESAYRAEITAEGIPGAMNQSLLWAELAAARQRATDLEAELENQKASTAQARICYEQALSGYQTSTSWRVTRPLRWIKTLWTLRPRPTHRL